MRILGVSLSEFHDKAGFKLLHNIPEDSALTELQFKLYSDLILPRDEICDRILAIQYKQDYFLVVSPLLSKNKEFDKTYQRQKYIYSLSILVAKEDYLDKVKQPLFKQVVSKIGKFFKVIEEANHIVYKHGSYEDYIKHLLEYFYQQINEKGSCDLTYLCSHYSFINANYPPFIQSQPNIYASTVPVTLLKLSEIAKIQSDLGRQLLTYAHEGLFTFRKICRLHRDRKQPQLRSFYMRAAEKGVVFLLDMINLQNTYFLTKQIKEYLPQQSKHDELTKISAAIALKGHESLSSHDLLCLYLQFNRVTPLHKYIEINRRLIIKIDLVKLIRLAQVRGILKRVHQKIAYTHLPVPLVQVEAVRRLMLQKEKDKARSQITQRSLRDQMDKIGDALKSSLASGLSIDEMMTQLQVDYQRLMKLLNPQGRYILQVSNQ